MKESMKLNALAGQVYTVALNEARLGGHALITPSHFLYAMLLFDEGRRLVRGAGGIVSKISNDINIFLEKLGSGKSPEQPSESMEFVDFMNMAEKFAKDELKKEIGLDDALLAMLGMDYTFTQTILNKHGASFDKFDKFLALEEDMFSSGDSDKDGCPPNCNCKGMEQSREVQESMQKKPVDYLKTYATDMIEKARQGEYDVLIGREDVLKEILLLLSRRGKNNPVLVGDGGVGKTAVLEGLAQRIAAGEVPKKLQKAKLYHLDMGVLIAGTKYRGDFEDRLIGAMEAAKNQEGAIICIDEIHTIVGAGTSQGSALDASSILKPYLGRGELRFIGTTTFEDYKKHIEKSPALLRRFHKIDIDEPTADEAIEILKGTVVNFTKHHKVIYSEDAIEAAVRLTHKYVKTAKLPDKALDVLDIAGAAVAAVEMFSFPTVSVADIERAVAKLAKIPETDVSSNEVQKLSELEERVKRVVFGQDEAVAAVAKAIKAARIGLNDAQKPIASLLFVGPTGVGKTEIARTFADVLGMKLIRFDMSEYQESHTTSRLVGAAPGYIGHDEGGLLVDAVRKNPSAILLLDEIEKAHPNILNVLLQAMDYGVLTDAQGKKADFRNVIIVMTSNAGAAIADRNIIGFGDKKDTTAIMAQVEKTFSPEFRNRLTKIVKFNPITPDIAVRIAKKAVGILQERVLERGLSIETKQDVFEHIAKANFSATYGAREIIRYVEGELKDQIVDAVIDGGGNLTIEILLADGEVKVVARSCDAQRLQESGCYEGEQTAKIIADAMKEE